jgi:hypothetical protein
MFCGQSHADLTPEPATAPTPRSTPSRHRTEVRTIVTGDAALVCPHCQTSGHVKSKRVKVKRGISGGKATGAVLTLGVSMLATGLSRKEKATQMTCGNCKVSWLV